MASTAVTEVKASSNELEQARHDARVMELKLMRKEADLRRAEEEKVLRSELQDMNAMIVEKLKNEELMAQSRLPLDLEHKAEIQALEDALKMEEERTKELERETQTMTDQILVVGSELEKQREKLDMVKHATAWDEDMVLAKEGAANLNEFLEKKKTLAGLHDEQQTEKGVSDRLTNEIEEMMAYLEQQKDLDDKIKEAQEMLEEEQRKHKELLDTKKALEQLRKKKERALLVPPNDDYKDIRILEAEKRAAHNAIVSIREKGSGNSNTLTSVDVRIRQLELKLKTINIFLQQHFSSEGSEKPREQIDEGASEVSLVKFKEVCHGIEESQSKLCSANDTLEGHDASIEQLQLKINVLRGALISNNMSSQLYFQQHEQDKNTLAAHLESLNAECEEVEAKVTEENQRLSRQLRRQ